MMVNRIGAVLIIGASSAWGCLAAHRFTERCRLLRVWIWVLEIVKTEIYFQARLLPEVLQKVATLVNDREIGNLFRQLAASVEYGAVVGWTDGWRELLVAACWKSLKPAEKEVLQQLGLFLGSTDRQDQLAKLNTAKFNLEQLLLAATTEERKQVGLYRYLGFAAGAMLVLWLG
jgi:stage III sporulation protein AB